jgi:RND family efflux transporter MFP subunit
MLTLYSPELVASQEEYLLALRARDTMRHASMESMQDSADSLIAAARSRLEHLWNLDAATLAEIERTRRPVRSVPLLAPADGFILSRNAFPNQHVTPETELYTLADLRHVWIVADVAEADAPFVRMGSAAIVELSYAPGRKFASRVTNLLPQIDAQTRTLKVRLEADNPSFALKPELFVTVTFRTVMPARLTVPEDAVIDTGATQTVFVDRGNGNFEPRRVETGEHYDGRVEIASGLDVHERIALSGAFLLDSESKMRGIAASAQAPVQQERHHD